MLKALCSIAILTMSTAVATAQELGFETPLMRDGQKADLSQLLQKPSTETTQALKVLQNQVNATKTVSGISDEQALITDGLVEASDWSRANNGYSAAVADQVLIRFAATATDEDISNVIEEYDLDVIEVYVGLGAINASTNLTEFFGNPDSSLTKDERLKAMIDATNSFSEDSRILAATPNIAIGLNNKVTNLLTPKIEMDIDFSLEDHVDWGVDDIKVRELWNEPLPLAPRVGVIDVGFALHEDLAFGGILNGSSNDHGNHVAGIICAKHNGKGIAGVVPDCQVIAKTGDFLPVTSASDNVQSFLLLFSQILLTMDKFVTDSDEVMAFNASLGYNWEANFGIDPSEDGNEFIRANIQNQAIFLLPVLDAAADRDILIFSAAGNDSSASDARDAVFASPFNWAARTVCAELGNCSGVIVEAHDQNGDRASFSNINGDISCPGVDILSAVSTKFDAYGTMSGTSMASPYCTGGFMMFSMLRPGYSSQEALECLTDSGLPQPHGTPRMDLKAALTHCPKL